jgi:hypothetical protein
MRSPAWALTWQLWWRHRWLWVATIAYVLALAGVCQAFPPRSDARELCATFGLLPLTQVTLVGFAILTLVTTGTDLEKNSIFPAWMFTLPVPTRTLVGWVMLNGTISFTAGWLALHFFVLRSSGIAAPRCLTLIAPSVLAWLQVLSWTPFPFPLVRLVLMLGAVTVIGIVPPLLEVAYAVPAPIVIGMQAASIAAAYPLAEVGVARARCGRGQQGWLQAGPLVGWVGVWRGHQRPFASAQSAQFWFDWRRNGLLFVQLVGCLLAFVCVVALAGPRFSLQYPDDLSSSQLLLLGSCLAMPGALAPLFGTAMGRGDAQLASPQLTPFLAARPLATATFVAVKFRIAALAAAIACGLGFLAALVCLAMHGNGERVEGLWHQLLQHYPPVKACVLLFLAPGMLWLWTWKTLAEGLWVGLTGRSWVGAALLGVMCAVLPLCAIAVVVFKNFPEYHEYLWIGLRCAVGLVLVAKVVAASLVLHLLHRRHFMTRQQLGWLAAGWALAVILLFGLMVWLLPPGVVSPFWLAVGCTLMVPLARLAATPLALEWNRHR